MKTPYDPAIRIGRRTVERIRLSLRAEMERITEIEEIREDLRVQVDRECDAAAGDPDISTHDWLRARHAQAQDLARRQAEAEAALDRLRSQAGEAYGRLRAAEKAAELHAERLRREALRKDQAEQDDLAAARRLLALGRAARRLLHRPSASGDEA